jgi:hypothetical protein
MSLIAAMRKKGEGGEGLKLAAEGEGLKLAAEGERQHADGIRRTNKRWGERRQVMLGRGTCAKRASERARGERSFSHIGRLISSIFHL